MIRTSLIQHAPRLDSIDAVRLARDVYGLDASASPLPSERDQNFLLTATSGDRFVLKIANATETRPALEAQNAAMTHLADRVGFCPRVLPTIEGDAIGIARGDHGPHLVRLVTYLEGLPLAQAGSPAPALLESLGCTIGRLDAALADFDHPAIHRDFHWDLTRAADVIAEHLPLVADDRDRRLVGSASAAASRAIEPHRATFRRSAVHHDANDWNVLVADGVVTGIIDFGDMVHGWTVADPAVAIAYAMLDAVDPLATAAAIVRGYHAAYPLRDDEIPSLVPLATLRLCVSACIAAWQQRQRPDDAYLTVSQEPIRRTLPLLDSIPPHAAERALREACGLEIDA